MSLSSIVRFIAMIYIPIASQSVYKYTQSNVWIQEIVYQNLLVFEYGIYDKNKATKSFKKRRPNLEG